MTSPDQHEAFSAAMPAHQPELLGATAFSGLEAVADSPAEALLTPAQRVYAEAAVASMSETLGLNHEDIRLVIDDTPETGRRIVAIDASPNGQHIGLYRQIVEQRQVDPDWYTIQVDGQRVDPLAGCTRSTYAAMITDARARGEQFLPDSLALNQHNGHVWTATMMTGEPLESPGHIWIGSSSSYNKVNFVGQDITRGGKSFRVRPAVVVGRVES